MLGQLGRTRLEKGPYSEQGNSGSSWVAMMLAMFWRSIASWSCTHESSNVRCEIVHGFLSELWRWYLVAGPGPVAMELTFHHTF